MAQFPFPNVPYRKPILSKLESLQERLKRLTSPSPEAMAEEQRRLEEMGFKGPPDFSMMLPTANAFSYADDIAAHYDDFWNIGREAQEELFTPMSPWEKIGNQLYDMTSEIKLGGEPVEKAASLTASGLEAIFRWLAQKGIVPTGGQYGKKEEER